MNNSYFISIGKKERKGALALIIFHFAVMIFTSIVTLPAPRGLNKDAFQLLFNAVYQGIMIIIIAFFMKDYLKRMWQNLSTAKSKGSIVGAVFMGILFIYAFSIVANIVSLSVNGFGKMATNQQMLMSFMGNNPVILVLLTVCGAFTEEVIYRGVLFEFFYKVGQTASILLTAFLFGFVHIISTIRTGDFNGILDLLMRMLPYFMIGLALALEYVKYKNLWINIFTHAVWNLIACAASMLLIKLMPQM